MTTGAVNEAPFAVTVDLGSRLEGWRETDSGRFILSQQRHRNICRQFCQISRILAIAGLARKPVWSDITVTTSSGFLAESFGVSVEAPPTQDRPVPNGGSWPLIGGGNPPGFLNKCLEPRLEWLAPPQAHSAQPRSLIRALPPHSRSQSLTS